MNTPALTPARVQDADTELVHAIVFARMALDGREDDVDVPVGPERPRLVRCVDVPRVH